MSWGKEWPVNEPIAEIQPPNNQKQPWPELQKPSTAEDLATGTSFHKVSYIDDKIIVEKITQEEAFKTIELSDLKTQGSNLVDSEAYLYFQCSSCDSIFDPHTKSFAQLNQRRADAGWKVKWNVDGMGYKVYCVECGKGVE